MASDPVGVVARFAIQSDKVDDFVELAQREMVAPTRQEPGCVKYELWQEQDDPARFSMVEEWDSEEYLAKHLAQESLQAAVRRIMPMAAGPLEVTRYRPLRS